MSTIRRFTLSNPIPLLPDGCDINWIRFVLKINNVTVIDINGAYIDLIPNIVTGITGTIGHVSIDEAVHTGNVHIEYYISTTCYSDLKYVSQAFQLPLCDSQTIAIDAEQEACPDITVNYPTPNVTCSALSGLSIGCLSDVDSTNATLGSILVYNGTNWVPANCGVINTIDNDIGDPSQVGVTPSVDGLCTNIQLRQTVYDNNRTNGLDDGTLTITYPLNTFNPEASIRGKYRMLSNNELEINPIYPKASTTDIQVFEITAGTLINEGDTIQINTVIRYSNNGDVFLAIDIEGAGFQLDYPGAEYADITMNIIRVSANQIRFSSKAIIPSVGIETYHLMIPLLGDLNMNSFLITLDPQERYIEYLTAELKRI